MKRKETKKFSTRTAFEDYLMEWSLKCGARHPLFYPEFFYGFDNEPIRGHDIWYFHVDRLWGDAMLLTYDSTNEMEYPFAVYSDWKESYEDGERSGTSLLGEYKTMEEACQRMLEPVSYLSHGSEKYGIEDVDNNDVTDIKDVFPCAISFWECVKKVREWISKGLGSGLTLRFTNNPNSAYNYIYRHVLPEETLMEVTL